MASPQTGNGHTQIANEVLEKIYQQPLTSSEFRVVFFVIRKTWGWKKKEDKISLSQIAKEVGIPRSNASDILQSLVAKRLLVKTKGIINTLQFNKDYEKWVVAKRLPPSRSTTTTLVAKQRPEVVATVRHTQETIKETITKETIPNGIEGSKINTFIGMFKSINPSFERLYAQKGQRDAMSRLISRYGEQKVENMLRELPSILQKPYAPIITTPYQLEQKLGALLIFIKKEGYGQSKVSVYTGK